MEKSEATTTSQKRINLSVAQLLELLGKETEHAFAYSAPFYDGWRVEKSGDQ